MRSKVGFLVGVILMLATGCTKTVYVVSTDAPTTSAPTTDAPTTSAPTTEAPTTEAPTTDAPKTYKVGETGPGGGTIFYVDLTRPAGSQYFEAACAGWYNNCDGTTADPEAQWGDAGADELLASGTAIGTGEQNTADIVNMEYSRAGDAGRLADDYSNAGQSDWFLPSPDELNQMYIQMNALGYSQRLGCWGDTYWSSSTFISDYYGFGVEAWAYNFSQGYELNLFTDNMACVWPVRSF
jgi:hypothetical protein